MILELADGIYLDASELRFTGREAALAGLAQRKGITMIWRLGLNASKTGWQNWKTQQTSPSPP